MTLWWRSHTSVRVNRRIVSRALLAVTVSLTQIAVRWRVCVCVCVCADALMTAVCVRVRTEVVGRQPGSEPTAASTFLAFFTPTWYFLPSFETDAEMMAFASCYCIDSPASSHLSLPHGLNNIPLPPPPLPQRCFPDLAMHRQY